MNAQVQAIYGWLITVVNRVILSRPKEAHGEAVTAAAMGPPRGIR
jgi:hypothetical protein